jgi:putative ABC transport system substrate-binding protein
MRLSNERRDFIVGLGSAAAWPVVARAQLAALPVIGFVDAGSAGTAALVAAFRKGLGETGYVEGQNVTVEDHYLEGEYDGLTWSAVVWPSSPRPAV